MAHAGDVHDEGVVIEKNLKLLCNDNYSLGYQVAMMVDRDLARVGGGKLSAHKTGGILGETLQKAFRLLDRPINYLEIGSQFGGSAVVAGLLNKGGEIVCIDPMETLEDHKVYGMVNTGHRGHTGVRPIFEWNMEHYGVSNRVTLIEELSVPFPELPEGFVPDVTYVDGDHSEEFAYADVTAVAPITTHFIVMDDYIHWSGVRPAVKRFLRDNDRWDLVYADYAIAVLADVEKTGKEGADLNFITGVSQVTAYQSRTPQPDA